MAWVYRSNVEASKALLDAELIDADEFKEEKASFRKIYLEEMANRSKASQRHTLDEDEEVSTIDSNKLLCVSDGNNYVVYNIVYCNLHLTHAIHQR